MSRIIDFFDGAQSETTPTIGNIIASGIVTYPDDATYEANEQGAPIAGNIYFNTTIELLRYYTGTSWISIVDEESLQTIVNKTIEQSTIDADLNTITNLEDDNIKVGAAINAEKIHDGSVDNTEFGHLDGVTSNIQTQLDAKQETSEKGQPNGYASLDGTGKVPLSQLPIEDVDNVDEFADFASFPATGVTDRIYIAADTNVTYRWTGSVYIQIGSSVEELSDLIDVNTTGIADGQILKYVDANSQFEAADAVEIIDDLGDVDTTTNAPALNQVLTWDGTNFVPEDAQGGASELNDLDDVDLTTTPPVIGDRLRYDGTDWVPFTPEKIETVLNSDFTVSNPTGGTQYQPNSALRVDLDEGVYNLSLQALYGALSVTAVIGNQVTVDVAFSTSPTPGVDQFEIFSGHSHCYSGNNLSYTLLNLKKTRYVVTTPVSVYVHISYRDFSGSPTITSYGFRSESGSGNGLDPILTAERVG